jgi:hypothetical protein
MNMGTCTDQGLTGDSKIIVISLARRHSGFFGNLGGFGAVWKYGLGCE